MPGQQFEGPHYDETRDRLTAVVGFHGLNIRVHVDPDSGFPAHMMKPLLERFRMFHGPLNEVTIVGADDVHQARSIEASISLPHDNETLTMHEVLVHVTAMKPVADQLAQRGHHELANTIYQDIRGLIHLSQRRDETPWTGWFNHDWTQCNLERLLICNIPLKLFISDLNNLGGS